MHFPRDRNEHVSFRGMKCCNCVSLLLLPNTNFTKKSLNSNDVVERMSELTKLKKLDTIIAI